MCFLNSIHYKLINHTKCGMPAVNLNEIHYISRIKPQSSAPIFSKGERNSKLANQQGKMLRDSSSHLLLLISVSVLCSSFHYVRGQVLKRQDKQALLDQHNYHRAAVNAANMRRLVSFFSS